MKRFLPRLRVVQQRKFVAESIAVFAAPERHSRMVFRMIFRIAVNRNVLNEKNDEKSKKVLTKAEGFGNINFAVARKKE